MCPSLATPDGLSQIPGVGTPCLQGTPLCHQHPLCWLVFPPDSLQLSALKRVRETAASSRVTFPAGRAVLGGGKTHVRRARGRP